MHNWQFTWGHHICIITQVFGKSRRVCLDLILPVMVFLPPAVHSGRTGRTVPVYVLKEARSQTGGMAVLINLSTGWGWVANFTSWLLYPQVKSTQFPLKWGLGGSQNQSGHIREEKPAVLQFLYDTVHNIFYMHLVHESMLSSIYIH
jgi:hypothetical protein